MGVQKGDLILLSQLWTLLSGPLSLFTFLRGSSLHALSICIYRFIFLKNLYLLTQM